MRNIGLSSLDGSITQAADGIPVLMLARVLDTGGIERDVSKFSRHLQPYGIYPHVACFNSGGTRWQEIADAGIPLITIPIQSFKSKSVLTGASALKRYITEKNIRLLHAFDVPADMFAVPLGKLWGIPILSSQLCYRDLCNAPTRIIMTIIDRLAAGVFVNCEGIAAHLSDDWKLPRRKIHVCHNGYEPSEFNPEGRRRPSILKDASTVIGTVALLRPEKNLLLLIDAFAGVHQVDPKAKLIIVGSGPMKSKLMERVRDLGITDVCIFHEAVERPADWMRAIDIFVLPSRSEGFSNSLLEAMACGCCPVASRVGGTPELIKDHQSGILFTSDSVAELTNALCYLVRNQQEIQKKGMAAAEFVEQNYTIEIASARLAGIYREMIDETFAPD